MAGGASGDQTTTNVPRGGSAGISSSGLRNRVTAAKANSSKGPTRTATKGPAPAAAKSGFSIRLYDDDAPGLKVSPTTVLISSLVYIASVVLLHVWNKFRSPVEE